MKINTILFFIILLLTGVNAQILQWTPYFATADDSIVIIYDASQGNGALANQIPIYVHTGVITNLSTSPTDWRYVRTTWGQNTNQPQMTYLGNNKWRFGYHIRNYYQVPQNEQIFQLAFVFRNASGTLVGRSEDGSDIYLTIAQPGLNVAVVSPSVRPYFVNLNDTVKIELASVESTNLQLYINNNLITQTASNSISYNYVATEYGKFRIKAVATGTTTKSDSTYFIVHPPVNVAEAPAGIQDGINYTSVTSATLLLTAPEKQFVYVLGDFNNWEVEPAQYMNRTPDGKKYWVELNNLSPAFEYAYQFLIDGNLRVADPYSDKILDPWNDQHINSATYPNLKSYPTGKTSHLVSVLQTAQSQFPWQITNFQKPAKEDLVIYELLIRDFVTTHTYKTIADTLSYLKSLGVNALELMPIMEFEGNESWGYNSTFHFAPDKYYGPKDELKKLIDKAHSMGIAVIMDIVLNHAFGQSSMVRMYWDSQNNRPAANNPWFNPAPKHAFNVGYDMNHESDYTKYYVDRVTKYWIEEYKVDGFRFDLSKGFTQVQTCDNNGNNCNVGAWGNYDQSRINLLKRMADKIWEVDPTNYVILEHFADNSEEIVLANYGMMLWGNMNHAYLEAAMGYNSDFAWGSYKQRGWNSPHLISYMESHDEERMMFKNINFGNSSGSYNIKNLSTALNRVKLASAFFYTIPGAKMLWQFGEVGYDYSIDYDCRVCNKPIRWDYYENPQRKNIYKVKQALIKLKLENEAFRSTDFTLATGGLTKRININHSSMNVAIIGNFDVNTQSISANFQNTGWWYDYFSGDSIFVSNTTEPKQLQAGEFNIYTTVKLPTPEQGILTEVEDFHVHHVEDFMLEQNFPNPFNPSTIINYSIKENSFVTLKIYNTLGEIINILVNEIKPQGYYSVNWNGENINGQQVPSGVYFYRIDARHSGQAGEFSSTKKMMLVR